MNTDFIKGVVVPMITPIDADEKIDEAQFKLNPVRLSMDGASFPVAAKDMAILRGLDVGAPYLSNILTPEGPVLDKIRSAMKEAGLID